MKLKKGDNIIVLTGKDNGKKGKIVAVFSAENKVLIEGVNMKKKHQKARKSGEKGQMIEIAHPINASNVAIVDPKTGKASRIGHKIVAGKKIRISKKSGVEI